MMNVCRLSACLRQRLKATASTCTRHPRAISSLHRRLVPPSYPSSIVRFFASSDTNMSDGHGPEAATATATATTAAATPPPFDIHSIQGPFGSYAEEYQRSLQDPEAFWGEAAKAIHWFQEPTTILQPPDPQNPLAASKWFPDGTLNISYNCLDVHIQAGRGDQDALIYDSPVTGVKERYTYRQLLEQVELFAGVLQEQCHVQIGDRVVLYMPMIPQAVIAMLSCTRIGAIHSVVFGGFAAHELATRITDCQPKVVVSASCGVEPTRVVPYQPLLQRALELTTHPVPHTIMVQRPNVVMPEEVEGGSKKNEYYLDYDDLMAKAKRVDAVPVASDHPHYVLYTSGTTGLPKGVVRDTGGSTVALKYSMDHFYNVKPGDVFWAASDIGWVVGHSYIVYAPLLHGCTAILYEGKPVGTPDAGAFWRVCEEYRAKALFVAPTAFRAMKQADPNAHLAQQYDLSGVETIFLAGEHSDPETMHWIERATPGLPPPIDHWWQTELGWPAVGNSVGLGRMPARYGSCAMPVPGFQIHILDAMGNELPPHILGDMVIQLPLPPGTLQTIYNDDERYRQEYLTKHPGYYDTGDAAYKDDDGFVYIMGRTDDVINTAGHRLSTGAMEEILMEHPNVSECAVIPVKDDIKGQVPIGFVICNAGTTADEYTTICSELVQLVREEMGPVASFKKVAIVNKLPKTRSGKILRGTMTKIANGQDYKITPTIEDPAIFDYLAPEIVNLMKR